MTSAATRSASMRSSAFSSNHRARTHLLSRDHLGPPLTFEPTQPLGQVGVAQTYSMQVRIGQVRPAEIGLAQIDPAQVRTEQIGPMEVRLAQISPEQLREIGPISPRLRLDIISGRFPDFSLSELAEALDAT